MVSLVGAVALLIFEEWRRVVTGMSQVVSKKHIIVCGWTPKARDAIDELRLSRLFRKRPITIIDDKIDANPTEGANTTFVRGSPADTGVLERANVRQAEFAIVFAEDATPAADQKTALTVLAIKNLNPTIQSSAELNDIRNEPHLRRAGCDVVVNTADLTSKLLASPSRTRPSIASSKNSYLELAGTRSTMWSALHGTWIGHSRSRTGC